MNDQNDRNDLSDPLAIAKALGLYEEEQPKKKFVLLRKFETDLLVVILSSYALITLGVYIGLIVHP